MIIDPQKIGANALYKILIGSILPRPIAWVSTVNSEGKPNLAPFSFFTVASCKPPVLCFSPAYKSEVSDAQEMAIPKDTLSNIRQTGQFVVNIVSEPLADKMNQTAGEYPPGVNEFEIAGLTALPGSFVGVPRVAESLVNMECKLYQLIEFGRHPGAGTLVLGEIVCIHLDQSLYKNGSIDPDVLAPIGRMGANFYCTVKDRFEIARPRVGS